MQVDEIVGQEFSTPLFLVKYIAGKYTLSWHLPLHEALHEPRYKSRFCAIDLVRTNAETCASALCHRGDTEIGVIADVIAQSVLRDANTNHIVGQCFFELGIL